MSTTALWGQATHTLTLIGQQDPSLEHIKELHDGRLTDLIQAIKEGKLPDRDATRKFYGLGPVIPEVIKIATLPEPKFPDWSQGRVLVGVKEPVALDLSKIIDCAYFHERQTGNQTRPTGHEILASLVKSYKVGEDKAGNTYKVEADDAINLHFGLKELIWLEQNWKILPKTFRDWAKGKLLYGHRDIVRLDDGWLDSPSLHCRVDEPYVDWYSLDSQWDGSEPGLREQVLKT